MRNFHIQAAKAATTSDIIVYGDDETVVRKLGWAVRRPAQVACPAPEPRAAAARSTTPLSA